MVYKEGITHVSIENLAQSLGVSKGLIYYYFSSKMELMKAVIESEVNFWKLNYFDIDKQYRNNKNLPAVQEEILIGALKDFYDISKKNNYEGMILIDSFASILRDKNYSYLLYNFVDLWRDSFIRQINQQSPSMKKEKQKMLSELMISLIIGEYQVLKFNENVCNPFDILKNFFELIKDN